MIDAIGDILRKRADKSALWRGVRASLVVEAANETLVAVLGAGAADYARAVYVKNGTLAIACLSSVAAQEIKINEQKIIAEINKRAGNTVVEKLAYLA